MSKTKSRMPDFQPLARFLGFQVEPNRNIICQYGYPEAPEFADYFTVYSRVGPAKAGCDKPVNATWSDWPTTRDVTSFTPDGKPEYNDEVKTDFEMQLDLLMKNQKLALKSRIKSLDTKQRVGRYAASLIVARDNSGAKMDEPLKSLVPGQLVKLVPLYESQVIESEWDQNILSETYGEPTMYQVNEFATGGESRGKTRSFQCHPSRLIVAAEGALDGTNIGTPAMQGCFYALMDWEKIRMSAAEGMKKNADQRNVLSIKDGSTAPKPGTPAFEALNDDIDDFETGKLSTL
ncbi:anti-CBASS protein Acb1 family protein, partial [Shewanella sp.]|uniref:anti-CBASS protein Acb1 family protein n=1 Tax=Shewanella sp. TaxID=50422 RepID=UPI003566A017